MARGRVEKRKYRHCAPCNVNNADMPKHERTKLHKEMLRGGLEYERCPRCEENIKRTSKGSRLSKHLRKCRVKHKDFYKERGQFYVCTELMELLSRDIPEAEVMEARKEREALLDKFPSDDQSDAEEVLEPSVADLSRKEMLAKMEEMIALDTRWGHRLRSGSATSSSRLKCPGEAEQRRVGRS